MYKILAMDGGGIRSIFTARLLQRLDRETDLLETVDMIAGNSGGAIVAAALACDYKPEDIVQLFLDGGPKIFRDSFSDDIKDLFDLTGAKYDDRDRKKILKTYLGSKRLIDYEKKIVLPAFDLQHKSGRWKPISFHNFENSPYKELSFVDAVMASSAAQTYFPVYQIGDEKFSDGGIWANNPSMAALTEATSISRGARPLEEVVILNIGTILNQITLNSSKTDMGILDWIRNGLIDMILDSGAMDAVAYYCQGLLGPRYQRLNLLSDERLKLDDINKMQRLIDIADDFDLRDAVDWVHGFWI